MSSTRDEVLALHRAARAELREGMAALKRVSEARKPKPRSYDSKCEDLAQDFLEDGQPYSQAEKEDLAQTIQNAIEDWLFDRETNRLVEEEQP